ncbi:MAG: radical SAM protein [Thermodesulfobacteriota bacterium]|nr:radical SAM protein [Thermodesulfobacteriota bacterium]
MNGPFILAWEITKACNLNCLHCRASAGKNKPPDELSTSEGFNFLEELKHAGTKMVILTGGEPLIRDDIFELAEYGTSLGLRMTLATNGSLVNKDIAAKIRESGIQRVSVSLDGTTSEIHDRFRGMPGAFNDALRGISCLEKADCPFQINTTVAAMNVHQMDEFPAFVESLGAMAWHVFFLVPTGRGHDLEPAHIDQYRAMLSGFYQVYMDARIECKATCAPQFYRILAEKGQKVKTKGCLAGTGFGFVSSTGVVQPCGFLQIPCGNIRQESFADIWTGSKTLTMLRDPNKLKGKCRSCTYRDVCGGCRARAYEIKGDELKTDPICWYKAEKDE